MQACVHELAEAEEDLEFAQVAHKRLQAEVERERIQEEMRRLQSLHDGAAPSTPEQDIAHELAEAEEDLEFAQVAHKRLQAEVEHERIQEEMRRLQSLDDGPSTPGQHGKEDQRDASEVPRNGNTFTMLPSATHIIVLPVGMFITFWHCIADGIATNVQCAFTKLLFCRIRHLTTKLASQFSQQYH